MENSKGTPINMRNSIYLGKQPVLPPKSPFPNIAPSFADYVPAPIGSRVIQRTSSESILMEEIPSWFDDLLKEPETPVRRGGHRRSSSDSFASYINHATTAAYNINHFATQDDFNYKHRSLVSIPSWGSQEFCRDGDAKHANVFVKQNNNTNYNCNNSNYNKFNPAPKAASEEERDCSSTKPSAVESDSKRAKQQFAQRSRVRKLQYIAELERNVQHLMAEGCGVSAELDFLNQRNIILSLENKALKQQLENINQEQLIKYMEQEVLEREIGRLRVMYQQQQQIQPLNQNQPFINNNHHRRSRSRDLDSQFANLSMKSPHEANPN